MLISKGKKMFFITNSSGKSRIQFHEKICKLGFRAFLESAYPSSYLAAAYLRLNDPKIKKIYVIGREGITTECKNAGF